MFALVINVPALSASLHGEGFMLSNPGSSKMQNPAAEM